MTHVPGHLPEFEVREGVAPEVRVPSHRVLSPADMDTLEHRIEGVEEGLARLASLVGGSDKLVETSWGPLPVTQSRMGIRRAGDSMFYPAGSLSAHTTALTVTSPLDTLFAMPFYVSEPVEIDALALHVSTSASGNIRLGVYEDGSNLYPSRLLFDAGTVSTFGTGLKTLAFEPRTLRRGVNWIACVSDNSGSAIHRVREDGVGWPILGHASASAFYIGWSVSFTYALLPGTYPIGASKSQFVPLLLARIA